MARGGLVTDEVEAKKKAGVAAPAAGKSVGAVERKEEKKEAGAKVKKDEKKGGQSKGRKTIELTDKFSCRAKDLWEIVMDENRWKGFTQSNAGISREVGGEIAVFHSSVMGSGVELQEGKLIVQKWRFRSCPDGFTSMVKLIFEDPEPGVTIVRLTHSDIPEEDRVIFYCVDLNKVSQALVKCGSISKMPAIQVWKDGEMKAEVIGGHKAWIVIEEVKEMIKKFL